MPRGRWTISNAISFLRILLLVPISILLLKNDPSQRWFVLGLMIFTAATDMLDGVLARSMNQVTEFGRIIDPIADKTGIAVVGLILAVLGIIPAWFFIAAVLRDLLILTGGLYLSKKKEIILPSNRIGKWTAGIMTLYMFCAFIDLNCLKEVTTILLAVSTVLIILSFTLYLKRFLSYMKDARRV